MTTIDLYKAYKDEDIRRLKEAVSRTDEEKFCLFMKLMRIGKMLKNVKTTINQQ